MNGLANPTTMPDWLGTALIGAAIAAIGFVAKQTVQWLLELRTRRDERRARLLELSSLLRASKTLFLVQNVQARRLSDLLAERLPEASRSFSGFESLLSGLYDQMTPEERELHGIIRSATRHGLYPLNESILEWIRADSTYRTNRAKAGLPRDLAAAIHQLETHLLLWMSKYAAWIPENPKHALIYLGDEAAHGPPFPQGIEELVETILNGGRQSSPGR